MLLANILQKPRAWILAHPEYELDDHQTSQLKSALVRLYAGEPLPYIIGHWEFFGLDFLVTPAVLIPRPETEMLVERALEWLRCFPERRRAVDVGTGSGCIAISLAKQIPDLHVVALDRSFSALQIAAQNAHRQAVYERVTFVQADMLGSLVPFRFQAGIPRGDYRFDLIVANLPYIPSDTLSQLAIFGKEPQIALDGGIDGLEGIRRLLPQVAQRLAPGGLLLLEIEATQGRAANLLAQKLFPAAQISLHQDLSGKDRLICVKMVA